MQDQADTNRLRQILLDCASRRTTTDYKSLAANLNIQPPHSIAKTTALIEACQEDDALLAQPQLTALIVSRTGEKIPRPGFFQTLKKLGIYEGKDSGSQAQMWHQNELEKVFAFYCRSS